MDSAARRQLPVRLYEPPKPNKNRTLSVAQSNPRKPGETIGTARVVSRKRNPS